MNKKWIFLPLISTCFLALIGVYFLSDTLNRWAIDYETSRLKTQIDAIEYSFKYHLPENEENSLNQYIRGLPQATDEQRISIIDRNGVVIGDTNVVERNLSDLENHKNRDEIKQALNDEFGISTRYSSTKNIDMLYVAKKVNLEGLDGFIRVSMPLSSLQFMVDDIMRWVGLVLGLLILTSAIASWLSQKLIQTEVNREKNLQDIRIQERTREIELLQRFANMMAACNSISESQTVVEDIVPRLLGNINGAVSLMRASRNQLSIELDWGGQWPARRAYGPEECWALRKGKFHLSSDHLSHLSCEHMTGLGDAKTLCIPLIAHSNTVGMMHLYLGDEELDDTIMQRAFSVAEHIGLALANLQLQDKLREQALKDSLTGLYNRRFFDECLGKEIMRATRHNAPLSLLMLDLDHFKQFNDSFGHDAGDYVLKSVCALLLENVRGEDTACRIGGEELAVLLSGLDAENAREKANELCNLVRDLHLELNGIALGRVTVSIGISTFPGNAEDPDGLMKLADLALYEAKEQGRDRVCHYQEMQNNTEQHSVRELPSKEELVS